ncbi:MAG TPA: hypothetical protein DEP35_02985 [Deltaproteobacteria bacterium]|nr:hypothetical protein [Deltaproteobacteria bacterium]
MFELGACAAGERIAVAALCTLEGLVPQPRVLRLARGHGEAGEAIAQIFQRERAALGDLARGANPRRLVGEARGHLLR